MTVSVYLDAPLRARLDEYARNRPLGPDDRASRSRAVRELLRRALEAVTAPTTQLR